MAIVKFGPLISGIRGTIGGTIFSANKGGPFARAWGMPVNPNTAPQTTQRSFMATNGDAWKGLSSAQRTAWDTYAALPAQELTNSLGEAYYISGFGWFCKMSTNLLLAGRSRNSPAPVIAQPAAPTVSTCYAYTPITVDFHVRITYPVNEFTGVDVIVLVSFARKTTPVWLTSNYRFVCGRPQQTTTYTEFGFRVYGYFADPPSGGKCFYKIFRQTTEGRRSPLTTKTANVITL